MDLWSQGDRADLRGAVLPYRCEPDDLVKLLDARARGWALPQIRSLNFSAKNFEGTVLTAESLGLMDGASGELTPGGRRFALADPTERPTLLRTAIEQYEPYALLLEAILGTDAPGTTEVGWVERWWSTNGYGSSQSNRSEAATVFARFVEQLGLGMYIQGRRGHPSRIEWDRAAGKLRNVAEGGPAASAQEGIVPRRDGEEPVEALPSIATQPPPARSARRSPAAVLQDAAGEPSAPRAPNPAPQSVTERAHARSVATAPGGAMQYSGAESDVTVELAPGRLAHLRVPATLTAAEKSRLLALLDLLITTPPGE